MPCLVLVIIVVVFVAVIVGVVVVFVVVIVVVDVVVIVVVVIVIEINITYTWNTDHVDHEASSAVYVFAQGVIPLQQQWLHRLRNCHKCKTILTIAVVWG